MGALISKAFGRSGLRRRQLMSQFVIPEGAADSKALEALTGGDNPATDTVQEITTKDSNLRRPLGNPKNRFFLKWDQQKLRRFLSAQRKHQNDSKPIAHLLGSTIKTVDPDVNVPKTSIWGTPTAECVANAKRARWWRLNAEKMMPPLGKGEWELLGRLSRGAQETSDWQIPERRIPAAETAADEDQDLAAIEAGMSKLLRHASRPTAAIERERSSKRSPRSGQKDTGPYGKQVSGNGLSPRWFRRAYARTWLVTPKMEQNPNTLQYKFTWGEAPGAQLREAKPHHLSVFDGVDAKGRPLQKSSKE